MIGKLKRKKSGRRTASAPLAGWQAILPMFGTLFVALINDYAIGGNITFMEFMTFWILSEIFFKIES